METLTSRRRQPSGICREKQTVKSSTIERGIKPLPVSRSRDGAESGKTKTGWIKGCFCILALEIGVWWHTGNYDEAGASNIPGWFGRKVVLPT